MSDNVKWGRLDMKKEVLDTVEKQAYESKFWNKAVVLFSL